MRLFKVWNALVKRWNNAVCGAFSALPVRPSSGAVTLGKCHSHAHIQKGLAKASVQSMAHRIGVKPFRLTDNEWEYRDIVRRCASCSKREICVSWLGAPEADGADYLEFCPNAERFQKMKGEA